MNRPPFDDTEIAAVLGPLAPPTLARPDRVRLIGEAAQALLQGRVVGHDAGQFVGGALLGWLENGGNLQRDYLRVVKGKSHHTATYIWGKLQAHQDERQPDDDGASIAPSSQESEK
jgi:hypothetical protein